METELEITFVVARSIRDVTPEAYLAVLIEDDWDDWFAHSTMYTLLYFDESLVRHRLGKVKIGQFGMRRTQRRPAIPDDFTELSDAFFSLGQDDEYYDDLNKLGEDVREYILESLNDVAADDAIWQKAKDEPIMESSLLRSVRRKWVKGQFRKIAQGGARLTPFDFTYHFPKRAKKRVSEVRLEFNVKPESFPPTNIHVLIGRNGVGKTRTLNLMSKAFAGKPALARQSGHFTTAEGNGARVNSPFSNLVSVCFSAFDSFLLNPDDMDEESDVEYSYIGLRREEKGPRFQSPKSPAMLATEFVTSAIECGIGAKAKRWERALTTLETDRIFRAAKITSFIGKLFDNKERQKEAKDVFKKLSSGHQIVLLTITRLVQTVEEKTLVLLDEPEGHLHPPLLAAFIRSLSDLLYDRNGVAIIATHSPVVIQEVPSDCVWKLQRSGPIAKAERPDLETFGENVGILTREVFGYEVTYSGFHRMLLEVAEKADSFDAAVKRFNGELGAEAKGILRVFFMEDES